MKAFRKSIRVVRKSCFKLLDLVGGLLFNLMRLLRIVPGPGVFKKDGIKKILIIRIDRIGDVILSTPAIRAVRNGFPEAEITLLLREYTKELAVNNPCINKLLIYEKDRIGNDYDLSIALHPGMGPNYLVFASGARYRIGYTGCGGGFFLTHKFIDDRETRIRHEVESSLEMVRRIGCETNDKRLEVSVTEEGERFAEKFFNENKIKENCPVVVLHPGARQEYIRWKKEGFAEVADKLIKKDKVNVILTGGRDEEGLIKSIISLMEEKPVPAAGLRLTELVSLIKRCVLFIGNSTGPMHIAAALGVPVVAIFGNVHPLDSYQEWGPWGEGHIVVSRNFDCPDCHPGDCKNFDCMKLITAEEVLGVAERQLKRIKQG